MDDQRQLDRVYSNPKFADLVNRRRRFAWILTLAVLGSFFSYLMIGIARPNWLAIPLYAGAATTIGYLLGAVLIAMAWISTGIYIRRANEEFDPLTEEILRESRK
ncbi:MAG: DUF485 domain-containing protein [Rhodocyclaceae bacterium]|nr:DUF485 domain-containing protein [Rhodocyclaceae bacterium]